MTLILAMGNSVQTVLVSDRRLSPMTNPDDDESNKAAVVMTPDARLAVALSGLATAGGFRTAIWILEAILDAAAPERLAVPMIERFALAAETQIRRLNVPREAKGLVVMFAGYTYADDGSYQPFVAEVANFDEDWRSPETSFTVSPFDVPERSAYALAEGAHQAVDRDEVNRLWRMVARHEPAHVLVDSAVEIIRAAADSSVAGGVIGKQCTSVVLPADLSLVATDQYHSTVQTARSFGVNLVDVRGGDFGALSIADVMLSTDPDDFGRLP
jgi:hypothetical protein